jgi:hypothetical protein
MPILITSKLAADLFSETGFANTIDIKDVKIKNVFN